MKDNKQAEFKAKFRFAFDEMCSGWSSVKSGLPQGYFELSYLRQHRFRFEDLLKTLMKLPTAGAILDVGTSPFVGMLRQFFPDADISTMDLTEMQKQYCDKYRVHLRKSDLTGGSLPWEDGCFDAVVLAEVVEHLPCHPGSLLRECHRVLKPGGTLIVTTPNFSNLYHRLRVLMGWHVQEMWVENDLPGRIHYREYTKKEMLHCVQDAGLEVIRASHDRYWDRLGSFRDMLEARYWTRSIVGGKLGIALLAAVYGAVYVPLTILVPPFRRGITIICRRPVEI